MTESNEANEQKVSRLAPLDMDNLTAEQQRSLDARRKFVAKVGIIGLAPTGNCLQAWRVAGGKLVESWWPGVTAPGVGWA
jgi:hypothetical protein